MRVGAPVGLEQVNVLWAAFYNVVINQQKRDLFSVIPRLLLSSDALS